MSKQTIDGKRFMCALIEYELYTKEEIVPYFDDSFDNYILPVIFNGKEKILSNLEYFGKNSEYSRKEIIDKFNGR